MYFFSSKLFKNCRVLSVEASSIIIISLETPGSATSSTRLSNSRKVAASLKTGMMIESFIIKLPGIFQHNGEQFYPNHSHFLPALGQPEHPVDEIFHPSIGAEFYQKCPGGPGGRKMAR